MRFAEGATELCSNGSRPRRIPDRSPTENSRRRSIETELSRVIRRLLRGRRVEPDGRTLRHPKGWTPERRARQSLLIRGWQPWRRSTGPRTDAGKARSSRNSRRHGFTSRAAILELRRVRHALRLVDRNLRFLRLLVSLKRARERGLKLRESRQDARRDARHNRFALPEPSP
jgi:hypothetical protein